MREPKEFTFGQYLEAISGDYDKYINDLFGENANVFETYHMKTKKPEDLSGKYGIITDIDSMSCGQFIACESALTGGHDKHIALKRLCQYVLRPITDKEFDNDDPIKEKEHLDSVLNEDARSVLDVLNVFAGNRDYYIHEKYRGVFYIHIDENDEIDEEDDEPEDNTLEGAESKFKKQWYWYSLVHTLAEEGLIYKVREGISKIEAVLLTKMSDISPELSYKRQKQIINDAIERKERAERAAHNR